MSTVNLKSKPRKHGAGVYALVTTHDGGRIYVGESIDLYTRWKEHGSTLAKGTHHNRELQHLYNNGANFTFTVLKDIWWDKNKDKKHIKPQLRFWESFYILKYQKVCINRDSPFTLAASMCNLVQGQLQYHLNPTKMEIINKYLVE